MLAIAAEQNLRAEVNKTNLELIQLTYGRKRIMTATAVNRAGRRRGVMAAPAAAGVAFTVSWIAGLAIPAPSPRLTASGTAVVTALAGHGSEVVANFVLTEGLPAFGLLVVSASLARSLAGLGAVGLAITARVAGLVAAVISLSQCALGLALARTSAPGAARELYELVSRLDGAKMFALAALATAAAVASLLPGWLRCLSAALAISITASGVAYLFLLDSVAWLAYPAGLLLLAVIPATGYALGRARTDQGQWPGSA